MSVVLSHAFFVAFALMSIGRKALEIDHRFSGFLACSHYLGLIQALVNGAAAGMLPTLSDIAADQLCIELTDYVDSHHDAGALIGETRLAFGTRFTMSGQRLINGDGRRNPDKAFPGWRPAPSNGSGWRSLAGDCRPASD